MMTTQAALRRFYEQLFRSSSDEVQEGERTSPPSDQPEVLSPDQARMHDVNRLVAVVASQLLPRCRSKGFPVVIRQEVDLPHVPILVEPVRKALADLFELCLEERTKAVLRIETLSEANRVILTFERRRQKETKKRRLWREVGPMGRLELMVGQIALRALGGRLRVQRRDHELRARFEFPFIDEIGCQRCDERGNAEIAAAHSHYHLTLAAAKA